MRTTTVRTIRNVKIHFVSAEYLADRKVFVVPYEYMADVNAFEVHNDWEGGLKAYRVDQEYLADLKVFLVPHEYMAGAPGIGGGGGGGRSVPRPTKTLSDFHPVAWIIHPVAWIIIGMFGSGGLALAVSKITGTEDVWPGLFAVGWFVPPVVWLGLLPMAITKLRSYRASFRQLVE